MKKPKNSVLMLKTIVITVLLVLLSTTPFILTITAEPYHSYNQNSFTYNYKSNNKLVITYHTPQINLGEITNNYGIFTTLSIPNTGYIAELGKPLLPQITTNIALSDTSITFEIIQVNIRETFQTATIFPAQLPQSDSSQPIPQEFMYNVDFYQQNIEYPGFFTKFQGAGSLRSIPFSKFAFYPIQYNPAEQIVTVYDSITIQITSTNPINILEVENKFPHPEFETLYKNSFPNWQGFIDRTIFISKEPQPTFTDGADLIIITHPSYYSEAKKLARWRHVTGMMTILINVTDIGSTSSDIKNYIQNAYDTWDPQPAYVLLIGDAEYIPTSETSTDLYYVTTDGTDYYPDMYIGRIPADTLAQAEIMIDKILDYDQNPPMDYDFFENFAVAAYFQDDENNGYETRRFVRTSEEIRDNLTAIGYTGERIYVTPASRNPTNYNAGYYGSGEPLPSELLRANGFLWDGDGSDIENAINNGIFILNHRDHGYPGGWGDPEFDTTNIAQLTNGDLLPIVFSMNCQTGQFHNAECFCEEFVRKPNGGAVAAIGASQTSYSGYNDFLCLGFYDAIWPEMNPNIGGSESLYRLGQILNNGKMYMALTWGDPWGYEEIEFEMFHVFCDPSQAIRTLYPTTLTVDSPPTIPYGPSIVEITVTRNSQPIEDALVCLLQPNGAYARGYTDGAGIVGLEVDIQNPDEATLTVTAFNCLPYTTTVQIGSSLPPLPPSVDGTSVGKPNKEYSYTAETTDPENDQILYKFNWGDGTESDWIGPFSSGESVTTSHAWIELGNFTVKVRAKDIEDSTSYWSEPYNVFMTLPIIDLGTISGGLLKASVNIRNYGLAEADDISWTIFLDGGFILLGKETTGLIPTIEAGGVTTISTGLVFGFGATRVIVTVEIDEGSDYRSQGANVLFFIVSVKPGGG
jgi:hypothetical protein